VTNTLCTTYLFFSSEGLSDCQGLEGWLLTQHMSRVFSEIMALGFRGGFDYCTKRDCSNYPCEDSWKPLIDLKSDDKSS
jgi:hypothetical protein